MPSLHCSLRVSAAAPAAKTPKVFPARQRIGAAVKTNPQSVALVCGGRSMSHAELDARSRRAASALSDLGVRAGDRVALLMWNDFPYFEATRATQMLGAVNVPLNWHLTPAEIAGVLEHSGAGVVVAHSGLLGEELVSACKSAKLVSVPTPDVIRSAHRAPESASPRGVPIWADWIDQYPEWTDEPASPGSTMFYTSGSTGRPKGVSRAAAPPEAIAHAAKRSAQAWGLSDDSVRAVLTGPLYHSAPNAYSMLVLRAGGLLLLQSRFDAEELLRLVAANRITHLYMTPTMFSRLLALPENTRMRFDLSSLRHVTHGAAPCPEELKRRMLDWWGEIIFEYYGLTETGILTTCDSRQWLERPGGVGRAAEGIDLKVFRDNGTSAGPEEIGEICARSTLTPYVSYHRAEADTRQLLRGEYLATGDLGYLTRDGYLYVTGRTTDMVISGGVNIYPGEVELALMSCPGIRDCAVFGVPDADFGERLVAILQLDEDAAAVDADAVRQFLSSRLARFKIPREICFRPDLPREDSGKIRKHVLKAEHLRRYS